MQDIERCIQKEEADCERTEGDEERMKDGKIRVVSIIKSSINYKDTGGSLHSSMYDPRRQNIPIRKKVTLMGNESYLPLSPSNQPVKHLLDLNQKPIRSSGLDCGDIDPFVQSDSFVYLAVSARPASQGEATAVVEVPTHDKKQDLVQTRSDDTKLHFDSIETHFESSKPGQDAKPPHLDPQKPEEGDFLCTDSFVYLAAPACRLLGPAGTTPYSERYVHFFVFTLEPFIVCNSQQFC